MSSRREFVSMGALAVGAIVAGRKVDAGALTSAQPNAHSTEGTPLYAVVYDERLPECAAFAARARLRGQRAESLQRGDVTPLWYDDLYHRWKQGPAAIAGLTAPGALYVLETLGRDAGLRLQFKAEHRQEGGWLEHRLCGPREMLRSALALEKNASRWGACIEEVVCGARPAHFGRELLRVMTPLPGASLGEQSLLVSWVLAPCPLGSKAI